jgi:hypothetical protein
MTSSYATAEVQLDRLGDEVDPQGYDLCSRHAARTEAPRGWGLTDRRPAEDRATDAEPPPPVPRDLGSQATVDVLAAALRAVPEPAPIPLVREPAAASTPVVETPRRSVVETLLAAPAPAPTVEAAPAPTAARRASWDEPTMELPRLRAPRRVPAAGDRGPATDW